MARDYIDWDDFGGEIKRERRAKKVDALKKGAKSFGMKVNSFGSKVGVFAGKVSVGAGKMGDFARSFESKGKGKRKNRGMDFGFGGMFKL
jgi:hypothetical protein